MVSHFFSRTMPRGNDATVAEFNGLCAQHCTEYFHEVWQSDQLILDYYHRSHMPAWWHTAHQIRLDADATNPRYRHLVLDKLFPYHSDQQLGVCQFDNPDMTRADHPVALQFDNQYQYQDFATEQEWYEFAMQDARMNFAISEPKYDLEQIVTLPGLTRVIRECADGLRTHYDSDALELVWQRWSSANSRYLEPHTY